jgi:formylglycine-generating enzyme required for sulfatase activity
MKRSLSLVTLFLVCNVMTYGMTIEFVSISDPGFTGQMAKYEITNAQYCDFLNAALASEDIDFDVNGDVVSKSGEFYYDIGGLGGDLYGATNGGAARITYNSGTFGITDNKFNNHPVTYVSWYGATAFCNYYGYRLPTEDEWISVADYDGTYTYGCGTSINTSIANYRDSNHPDGTSVVGAFGISHEYLMADMAGNVWEWTSTLSNGSYIIKGGSWRIETSGCDISYWDSDIPSYSGYVSGFRVVIPEPATILILSLGGLLVRKRKH